MTMVQKSNTGSLPRFIALVGNPKAGKSLVQEILIENYGAKSIDSGLPLREIAMRHYGLTREQVFTQEGKLQEIEILGKKWVVRKLLGELGNRFEEMHGDWTTPWMSVRSIPDSDTGPFCDAACRKTQGNFYKSLGGVVIGIRNPMAPESPYEFDKVREEIPDLWIENDALLTMDHFNARKNLETKVDEVVAKIRRV